jgi:hypothetical protein
MIKEEVLKTDSEIGKDVFTKGGVKLGIYLIIKTLI